MNDDDSLYFPPEETRHVGMVVAHERLAYLERCAAAVEWVERENRLVLPFKAAPNPTERWRTWNVEGSAVYGPTWLAAVELAMKGTP